MKHVKNTCYSCIYLSAIGLVALVSFVVGANTMHGLFSFEERLSKKNLVGVTEPISMRFGEDVRGDSILDSVAVSPLVPFETEWNDSEKQLLVFPTKYWNPQQVYTISIGSGFTKFYIPTLPVELTFSTEPVPKVISQEPEQGATDVFYGRGDMLLYEFDRSIEGYDVSVDIMPEVQYTLRTDSDYRSLRVFFDDVVETDTTYQVEVRLGIDKRKKEDHPITVSSNFHTSKIVPDYSERPIEERLFLMEKYAQPKYSEGKYIEFNRTQQIMIAFEDGEIIAVSAISSGRRGMDTPPGKHQIYNKHLRPWSARYGLYMPYWMAITPDGKYGIHELPEWPSGYKEGEDHLGIPVSHGCVRLGVGVAEKIYGWAEVGTPVWVQ